MSPLVLPNCQLCRWSRLKSKQRDEGEGNEGMGEEEEMGELGCGLLKYYPLPLGELGTCFSIQQDIEI